VLIVVAFFLQVHFIFYPHLEERPVENNLPEKTGCIQLFIHCTHEGIEKVMTIVAFIE
jgi:hypothetical protein